MFFASKRRWSIEADVVVIGSGAAGLTAAIAASDAGAEVAVLECTDRVGGTTAVSGGGIWIPNNHLMGSVDATDNVEDAKAYCKALTMGRARDDVVEKFVTTAPEVIRYLEQNAGLKFTALTTPDYQPEVVGGRVRGRSIEPQPFDTNLLGEWKDRLRMPNVLSFPTTLQEAFETYQAFYRPWQIPQELVAERMSSGVVTLGRALAGALLKAVLERNVRVLLDRRASSLVQEKGRVVGLHVTGAGEDLLIGARKGVILASGGFEWNESLTSKFLGGPIPIPNSPPFNLGDGLLMAMEVGADLANMGEVWHYPSIRVPGETYENRALVRGIKAERSGPHIIWVNRRGKRFVNEAANYNSVGKTFFELDTSGPTFKNMPSWAIFDSQYRERYVVGTTMPEDPDPVWLPKADSISKLAELVGIDPRGLEETVLRWNEFVRQQRDGDFGKGESAFDRFQGDRSAPNPNMGSIERGPYYALPLHAGALGTKGGPRTDVDGRVVDVRGSVIPGLYAAGNVAASITGPSYYGVGSTLGPAITWGFIAGRAAARGAADAAVADKADAVAQRV